MKRVQQTEAAESAAVNDDEVVAEAITYTVKLTGVSPLLMHNYNLDFMPQVKAWQKDPMNAAMSVAGDDRAPAWIWLGYCYHNARNLAIPADNLMACLRDAGKKVPAAKRGSMKAQTQSTLLINELDWDLCDGDGNPYQWAPCAKLAKSLNFELHQETVSKLGFTLFSKGVTINGKKTVRVRPRFDTWTAAGTITVLDSSVISATMLRQIFFTAGNSVGLCDWRPNSKSPGQFGRFKVELGLAVE